MRYQGGKFRIAGKFLPIVLKDRKPGQYFVEPFCGVCNVTAMVTGKRLANDLNYYIIEMFKAACNGWVPPQYVDKHDYEDIRKAPEKYLPSLVGFIGVANAFGGKFQDTWARQSLGLSMTSKVKNYSEDNYTAVGKRSLVKLVPLLKGVLFSSLDYRALTIPKDSIVYCDPPYAGTSGYDGMPFDHSIFWAWVRNISMYHRVYVSEYVAPKDFISVWSHERKDNIDAYRSKGLKVREHLFIWKRGKAFETL